MVKNHLKRIPAPKSWPIPRKNNSWVTRPLPGSHPLCQGISLNSLMTIMLNFAKTVREVKYIINNNDVLVDGKRRKDHRHIVGVTDVFSIPSVDAYFRLSLNSRGKLVGVKISKEESLKKIVKITNIKAMKDKFALSTGDGRTIIVKEKPYKVGDSIMIHLPNQKIEAHIPFKQGAYVFIAGGKHVGKQGEVSDIVSNMVYVKCGKEVVLTRKNFLLPIGDKKPLINMNV